MIAWFHRLLGHRQNIELLGFVRLTRCACGRAWPL